MSVNSDKDILTIINSDEFGGKKQHAESSKSFCEIEGSEFAQN